MPYISIEELRLGATVAEFVDKINEIIAALNNYRPVTNYEDLEGKPTLNGVTLTGALVTGDLLLNLSGDATIAAISEAIIAHQAAIGEQYTRISALEGAIPTDEDIVEACKDAYVKKDLSNVEETVMAGKDGYIPVVGASGEVGKMKLDNATAMISTMQEAARSAADTALKEKRSYIPVEYSAGSATVTATTAFRIGTTLLHINGVLQAEGTDYTCTDNETIELLTYVPVAGDIIQLMAIPSV